MHLTFTVMTVKIFYDKNEKLYPDGYPLVLIVSQGQKRSKKTIGFSFPEHWSAEAETITPKHPDYDVLAPKIMDLKTKGRKLIIEARITDPKIMLEEILKKQTDGVTFMEYYRELKEQMENLARQHEKNGDLISANKLRGNIKVYENAVAQFNVLIKDVPMLHLDYPTLLRFKTYQQGLGNSKATVHQYLRTLRTIYNKGLLFYKLHDTKPFKGLFTGLTVKSHANKKKYITKHSIAQLERYSFNPGIQMHLDLFLLQFYLGGTDLKDLYYLKKAQLRKGRVYFERGKTDTGIMLDLKLHPKAEAIIKKYPSGDEWLFPWRKDLKGYEGFRRRNGRALIFIQNEFAGMAERNNDDAMKIDVLPLGGNLATKIARHTFANIAKGLMLPEDIIRELMGHQRDDVDNYYKDKYPQDMRDEALFKIIE